MTTTTPYTDTWREQTKARMHMLGLTEEDVSNSTGLLHSVVHGVLHREFGFIVNLEQSGPIDELLDKLEAASDAYAVEHGTRKLEAVHAGEAVRVERLAVSLDPLTNHEVKP